MNANKFVAAQPSQDDLVNALGDSGSAHHEYEQVTLEGKQDKQWPGFYAAFTLGRVGDFVEPSDLAKWLEEAPAGEKWAVSAANYVLSRLG
jgi:hypothetical protein